MARESLHPPEHEVPAAEPESSGQDVYSEDGVDLTLIRWMLSLTPAERLQAAQDMADTVAKLRVGRER